MIETLTIRVYNKQNKSDLEKSFDKCKDYFKSKNAFLIECMVRGLSVIERDIFGLDTVKDVDELYLEIKKTTETLNKLIRLSEKNAKETIAHLTVNQNLLSNNFNMLLGLSEREPKSVKSVECGHYEELPTRYKIILSDMLEELKKS